MATDRLGNTVAPGQIYLLAGVVRVISGNDVVLVLGDKSADALRVAAGSVVRVDDMASQAAIDALASVYQPVSVDLSAIAGLTPAVGSMLIYTDDGWVALAPGPAGSVLTMVSGLPTWSSA